MLSGFLGKGIQKKEVVEWRFSCGYLLFGEKAFFFFLNGASNKSLSRELFLGERKVGGRK